LERTRETSIQLGENKEDTYGNRWQTRRIRGPNKHLERRRARERERERNKERKKERKERKKERRARNGDNKDDKYGNRQWTRSIR
jgi:hypothetical protein